MRRPLFPFFVQLGMPLASAGDTAVANVPVPPHATVEVGPEVAEVEIGTLEVEGVVEESRMILEHVGCTPSTSRMNNEARSLAIFDSSFAQIQGLSWRNRPAKDNGISSVLVSPGQATSWSL